MRTPDSNPSSNSLNRKKVLIGLAVLGGTTLLAIGGSLAFFSDTLSSTNTTKAGTLDVTMSTTEFKMYVNGSATPLTTLNNFNPGDVLVIKGTLRNIGNKSAWAREDISVVGNMPDLNKIKVYRGEWTQANIGTATGLVTLTGAGGTATGSGVPYVINGTGTDAEVETNVAGGGTVPNGTAITVGNTTAPVYTVYFDPTADNSYQGKDVNVNVVVKAMQYRNNPTPVWTSVVSTPFGT